MDIKSKLEWTVLELEGQIVETPLAQRRSLIESKAECLNTLAAMAMHEDKMGEGKDEPEKSDAGPTYKDSDAVCWGSPGDKHHPRCPNTMQEHIPIDIPPAPSPASKDEVLMTKAMSAMREYVDDEMGLHEMVSAPAVAAIRLQMMREVVIHLRETASSRHGGPLSAHAQKYSDVADYLDPAMGDVMEVGRFKKKDV